MKSLLASLLIVSLFVGCQGIGPNGANTGTGGFDPSTLFSIGKIMAGKEAEKRYGVNPFELMGGAGAGTQAAHDCISWSEVGSAFAIFEAGKTNATMPVLFQILYQHKHPSVPPIPAVPFQ